MQHLLYSNTYNKNIEPEPNIVTNNDQIKPPSDKLLSRFLSNIVIFYDLFVCQLYQYFY
jgi:hypothetical protein